MAMKMHGVGTGVVVVDVDSNARVCAEVHYVPFWVVSRGGGLLLSEKEYRIVVVSLERDAVHKEELLASCVETLVYSEIVGDAWCRNRFRVVWNGLVERVLGMG